MANILVAFDGSKQSLKALHIACDLAEKYKTTLNLVYVLKAELKNAPESIIKAANERAQNIIKSATSKVQHRSVKIEIMDLEFGAPHEGILNAAKLCGASTIVMGCRGLKDDDPDYFGAVSRAVFQNADCTCISVK